VEARGTVSVGFILEVDPHTYLPRLQCIRYESPARTLNFGCSLRRCSPGGRPSTSLRDPRRFPAPAAARP